MSGPSSNLSGYKEVIINFIDESEPSIRCMRHGHLPNGQKVILGMFAIDQSTINQRFESALSGRDAEEQYLVGKYCIVAEWEKAFQMFSLAAEQNHEEALLELGHCYYYGQGTEINLNKAAHCYERINKLPCVEALFNLGMINMTALKKGHVPEDQKDLTAKKMFYCFSQATKKGHPEAQLILGSMYFDGMGTERNIDEALKHYAPKAIQGIDFAQFHYAECLIEKGNYESAYQFLSLSAKQGFEKSKTTLANPEFQHRYACCLLDNGDFENGQHYLDLSAKQGHKRSQAILSDIVFQQRYTCCLLKKGDIEGAFNYLSAKQGHLEAHLVLARLYLQEIPGIEVDFEQAVVHLKELTKPENKPEGYALSKLAALYLTGRGIREDKAEAVRLYHLAAELGHVGSMQNLGMFYHNGIGVPKDISKAIYFFELAADKKISSENFTCLEPSFSNKSTFGSTSACDLAWGSQYNLAVIYSSGEDDVEIDMPKALHYCSKAVDNKFGPAINKLGRFYTRIALLYHQAKIDELYQVEDVDYTKRYLRLAKKIGYDRAVDGL